jgi:hypothetical protein
MEREGHLSPLLVECEAATFQPSHKEVRHEQTDGEQGEAATAAGVVAKLRRLRP